MKKIFIVIFLFFALGIKAKRLAPKKINSVVHEGKEYIVNNSKPGTILIKDLNFKTSKEVTIYSIQYNPTLEKDVQDVFIKNIKLQDSSLYIKNEHNELYLLNLNTNGVTKIN